MKYRYRRHILTIGLLFCLIGTGCGEGLPDPVEHDWDAIEARDTLVALTTFNSTGYFLYRGQPMGYEYELLEAFAAEHDLELKVDVVRDRDSLYHKLNTGEGDVIAARVVPSVADTARIRFTRALYETPPSLVQRDGPPAHLDLPDPVDSTLEAIAPDTSVFAGGDEPVPDSAAIRARLITRPAELAGERVFLPSNSAYVDRLVELEDRITGDIEVVEVEGEISVETLIRRVAQGEIDLAVSQTNVAKLKESYFTNIVVQPQIGPPTRIAWAVRHNAPELQRELNEWIDDERGLIDALYTKYFVDRRGYRERQESTYLTSETGRLSQYDTLLQSFADDIGWDWRLLASQAYQESRFDANARSWAGAAGLLQIMPGTARDLGVQNVYDPEQNVAGAVEYLQFLEEYWADKIPEDTERLKFVLASYNAGFGHVEDARRLTARYGDDDTRWNDVAYWLLQKSKRTYYTDPVVRYGFCRGLEPVSYVALILERYDHYQEFVV